MSCVVGSPVKQADMIFAHGVQSASHVTCCRPRKVYVHSTSFICSSGFLLPQSSQGRFPLYLIRILLSVATDVTRDECGMGLCPLARPSLTPDCLTPQDATAGAVMSTSTFGLSEQL